jgi:hypothetical protein
MEKDDLVSKSQVVSGKFKLHMYHSEAGKDSVCDYIVSGSPMDPSELEGIDLAEGEAALRISETQVLQLIYHYNMHHKREIEIEQRSTKSVPSHRQHHPHRG